jgi:UDP-N-acetylenolpyruvoylglucosamine reductase
MTADDVANDVANISLRHNPAVVIKATTPADVQQGVRLAAERSLPVAVQATGHGMAMSADGAVLISTRGLTGIEIDPDARTARVAAGVRGGQLVAEAAKYGLAPLNGASPAVGVTGYTLGGGLGLLGRAHGYNADHVRSLTVVTADGELRTASEAEHADLAWASLGGKGNFGVVTSLELELFPVTRLYGGGLFFPGEAAAEVLHTWREWTEKVPDEMSSSIALLRFPPFEVIPDPLRGKFIVHVRIAYHGSVADGERLVAPLRAVAPAIIDSVADMPYTNVGLIHNDPTDPAPAHDRNGLLGTLEESTVDTLLRFAGPEAENPLPVVELRHLGGALARPPARPNAISYREAAFSLFTVAVVPPPEVDAIKARQQAFLDALEPWRLGGPFVAFMSLDDAPEDVAAAYKPDVYQRLREVKAGYDPGNLFRVNHNIPPA